MIWKISDYFQSWPAEFDDLVQPFTTPWDAVQRIDSKIHALLKAVGGTPPSDEASRFLVVDNNPGTAPSVFVNSTFLTSKDILLPDLNIFIGSGTKLERTAIIQKNTYISSGCEIRQAAYIRGNVLVGPDCVIGHTTEIKNSAFLRHVEAGHFSYIGDSIIGSYVNLGAGSILANLNFRSLEQKKNNEFPPMKLKGSDGQPLLGPSKLGAIVGDGSELGCNSVTAPGTFLGVSSRVLPCVMVAKGCYPPNSFIFK